MPFCCDVIVFNIMAHSAGAPHPLYKSRDLPLSMIKYKNKQRPQVHGSFFILMVNRYYLHVELYAVVNRDNLILLSV